MKVLFCGSCGDIRAFKTWFVKCECGNMAARWLDPNRGTVEVLAKNRDTVRIIGMNNHMLRASLDMPNTVFDYSSEKWQKIHGEATDAQGYIFDKAIRNCWACIVKVGRTNDISWAKEQEEVDKDPSAMVKYV